MLFGAYVNDQIVGFVTYKHLNPSQLDGNYKVCEVKTLSDIDPDPGYKKTREFYKQLDFIPLETIRPYPGWGSSGGSSG